MIASINFNPKKYYKKFADDTSFLIYRHQDDYRDYSIVFNKELKTYLYDFADFIDHNDNDFVPMSERPESTKHSAKYGYWASSANQEIPMALHKFVNEILDELGWL